MPGSFLEGAFSRRPVGPEGNRSIVYKGTAIRDRGTRWPQGPRTAVSSANGTSYQEAPNSAVDPPGSASTSRLKQRRQSQCGLLGKALALPGRRVEGS